MSEHKAGLHKKISNIFDGVPIPKNDNTAAPPFTSAKNQAVAVAPQPPAPAQQPLVQPAPAAKTAPQHSAPKLQQTAAQPAKSASAKPQKTDAAPAGAAQSTVQKFVTQLKAKLFKSAPGASSVRQKLMTILVSVLFVIFILVFIRLFSTPARKTAKPANPLKTASVVAAEKINWKIPDPWPQTLRDPMKLGSSSAASPENSAIIVRGIVFSEDNPAVIIGTQLMHQGDKVAGAVITKITEDSVEFEMNGKKWTQKVQH